MTTKTRAQRRADERARRKSLKSFKDACKPVSVRKGCGLKEGDLFTVPGDKAVYIACLVD